MNKELEEKKEEIYYMIRDAQEYPGIADWVKVRHEFDVFCENLRESGKREAEIEISNRPTL